MPITVYVWLPDKKRMGHGSIRLSNDTYMSWWPQGGKGARPKVTGTPERTLEEDIKDEGGVPNFTVQIPDSVRLNEGAMESWWDEYKRSGKWTAVKNCCWVVEEALIKGGIEKYLNVKGPIHISYPNQLLALMERIEAINVNTGEKLMPHNPTVDISTLNATITAILEGTMDTDLVKIFNLK